MQIISAARLSDIYHKPVMFDANIFMIGIDDRYSDKHCSFDHIKRVLLVPLLEMFRDIRIHKEVYLELDKESRELIDTYIGHNISIVDSADLYEKDPIYNDTYNKINSHDLFKYKEKSKDHLGEISSLAYAAHKGINYFCSKDGSVDAVSNELNILKHIDIITLDSILLCAALYYNDKTDKDGIEKSLKSMYKKYCADVIKRKKLPESFKEYVEQCLR